MLVQAVRCKWVGGWKGLCCRVKEDEDGSEAGDRDGKGSAVGRVVVGGARWEAMGIEQTLGVGQLDLCRT